MNVIFVQLLNNMTNNEDHFKILRKIQKKPESSQRELAKELGFSLGKLNYCLNSLRKSSLGSINPIFPAIGSTMTAAISCE